MSRSRKTTRRGISVKGITAQRLKDYCDATGQSVSGFLEKLIQEKLDAANAPTPTKVDPPKSTPRKPPDAGQYFTF